MHAEVCDMTALTFARFGPVYAAAQPRRVVKAGRVSASKNGNGIQIADYPRENGVSNGAVNGSHSESLSESSDKGKEA